MKNLKLTLIVAMLAVVSVASAQMRLGIKAGVNMSNFNGMDDNKAKIGFNVGVLADYDFAPNVGLQSGLFATTKGFKHKGNLAEYTHNLTYLQLPLHIAYKVDVTPGTKVFLHGGPYAAYGISGKNTNKRGIWELNVNKLFGDSPSPYKPFDAGLGIGAGFELGQVVIDLGWDMGLVDISNTSKSVKNQNAYLSLGYKF